MLQNYEYGKLFSNFFSNSTFAYVSVYSVEQDFILLKFEAIW